MKWTSNRVGRYKKIWINGLLIRSHCKWIEEGEKPTKYFSALEKRNYINKIISKLINDQEVEINNQNEILHEVKKFLKSLYENKNNLLDEVNLQEGIMEKDVKKSYRKYEKSIRIRNN